MDDQNAVPPPSDHEMPPPGYVWYQAPAVAGAPTSAESADPSARRGRRWPKVAAAAGLSVGAALGGAVLAAAATNNGSTPAPSTTTTTIPGGSGSSSSGSSDPSTVPTPPFGPGGLRALGGPGIGGPVIHGQFTVPAPNGGYETLQEQTGTVTDISDTSGSTWSLTVTSSDGTALTYVINTGTSIDGGETGVSSISKNDTVHVLAVVSNGTNQAKQVSDSTVMKANGQSWMPAPPSAPSGSSSSNTTG